MNFKDFYNNKEGHMVLLKNTEVSEAMSYHLENKLTLAENIFRIYSEQYFALIKEARNLYNEDTLALNDEDLELIESSLGEKAIYEGREVYLDAPISLNEDLVIEGLSIIPPNSIETKVYVDMDGVLCDLYKTVAEKMGKENYKDLTQKDYAKFFEIYQNDMDKIFADLPKYESVDFLTKMLKDVAGGYTICSAQLKNHDSTKVIKGKNAWLDKNLEDQPDQRIFERAKYKYASENGRPNILIDDWHQNIKEWINNGGIGIHYNANEDDLSVIIEGLQIARDILNDENSNGIISEATKNGKKVKLGHPFRTPGGPKKFAVYVKTPKGTIKKVTFGDPNMKVRNNSKARAKSFRARHKCSEKKDRTTAGYWSCHVGAHAKQLGLKSTRVW